MNNHYLDSHEAFTDFCNIIVKNIGKTLADVNAEWEQFIREKDLSVYNMTYGYIYPTKLTEAIVDAFEASGSIYSTFSHNWGINEWFEYIYTSNDVGRGHTDGDKKDQEIVSETKDIVCQYIYKYVEIPKKLIKMNNITGIVNWVLKELPQRILFSIERASIVGDPLSVANEDKITSFEAMVNASASYKTDITIPSLTTKQFYNVVLKALSSLQIEGPYYLVTSMDVLTEVLLNEDGISGFNLMNMMENLGIEQIYTRTWFNSNNPDLVAVLYAKNSYMVIGDETFENYTNFILAQNKNQFLSEIYQGGALTKPKSCVVIKK